MSMNRPRWLATNLFLCAGLLMVPLLDAQTGQEPPKKDFGKDFPGGPGGKGGPGGFGGMMMGQRRLLIAQFNKDGDGRLNAEERQAAREFIKKEGKGGFGPGGKGGPGGKKGPGGFGPGMFMAKPFLDALDADNDGKLSEAEFLAGVNTFFANTDKDKKGFLDQEQIAEGLSRIMPGP